MVTTPQFLLKFTMNVQRIDVQVAKLGYLLVLCYMDAATLELLRVALAQPTRLFLNLLMRNAIELVK